jgi:hypothetical protein
MWEILGKRNSLTVWNNLGTGGSVAGSYTSEGRAGSIPMSLDFYLN